VGGSFFHDMSEPRTDFELLAAFGREGDEGAFRQLVRRHLDLVYATALRKVTDPGAAEEIAQNVFHALARKATRFASDTSLPAWLHRTALLESRHWLRGELRRRRRKEAAAQLGTTMTAPDEAPDWRELAPLLDDALLSLREKDRTALLLRFHENKPLKEVGKSMGVGEDAAQKRVQTALERVAKFFRRHGHRAATGAIAATALQGTAQSAPAALAATTIQSTLAVAPATVLSGLSLWLARLTSLSKAKTALACAAVAAIPLVHSFGELQKHQGTLVNLQIQTEQIVAESLQLSNQLASLEKTQAWLAEQHGLEAKLRDTRFAAASELERLKSRVGEFLSSDDPGWPDDLPFVKFPKKLLGDLHFPTLASDGILSETTRDVYAITPHEAAALDIAYRRFNQEAERLIGRSARSEMSPDGRSLTVTLPTLGEDGRRIRRQLKDQAAAILGDERALSIHQAQFTVPPLLSTTAADLVSAVVGDSRDGNYNWTYPEVKLTLENDGSGLKYGMATATSGSQVNELSDPKQAIPSAVWPLVDPWLLQNQSPSRP
jgi:RNA polymerase sigma factor (sigma-70 family)